jgi:hypothetical protein
MCKPIETCCRIVDRALADDVGDVTVQVSETNADIATHEVVAVGFHSTSDDVRARANELLDTLNLSQNALAIGHVVVRDGS